MVIDFDTGVVDWINDRWLDIIDESVLVGQLASISDVITVLALIMEVMMIFQTMRLMICWFVGWKLCFIVNLNEVRSYVGVYL